MAQDAFISVQNIDKYFGAYQAVHGASVDIAQGEFFSLLGPSGCGKTTLLRMIAGFEAPTSGKILIDGQSMAEVPPHLRPVNMVFQSYAIFPHLNVRDNIAYGLRKQKLSRAKRYEMVDEMLDLIKLPGYGERRSNELSGGQRQRIALARALILRPKVLLLDEPLGALDKQLREQMQLELRALQRTVGITFVFVTHDQEEALTLSDRIAVMSGGKVLQIDTPGRLYEAPNSRKVASFIGTMNFFDAQVLRAKGDHLMIEAQGLGQLRAPASGQEFQPGDKIEVAIRPEKFALGDQKPDQSCSAVSGKVENVAYLGERSHFFVRLPGVEQPIAVSAQNRDGATFQVNANTQTWLSWDESAIVLIKKD